MHVCVSVCVCARARARMDLSFAELIDAIPKAI